MSSSDLEQHVCKPVIQNPADPHETHHLPPESHEMQQNPTETHESVPEAHETDHSPSAHLLSPTKTDETKPRPVKTHPSATETHKTDHNPPETLEMQHNLHQIPLQTDDTYHSPSAHLLSPTKTDETNPSPVKNHRMPTEIHLETHLISSKTHETYHSPSAHLLSPTKTDETKPSPVKTHPSATEMSETHNNPPETLEMHHNPMETHHSLSVSPAKTYESDPSSSPGEEALIKSNHSQTEKEEHKAEEDCASTNKSCLVAEYFHHGEMEGATQVFPALPESHEMQQNPMETHKSVPEAYETDHSPSAHLLSPTKTDETKPSPVKTHPSATETHKTDHNPPETPEMQHNLHQIPLQAHDTYHSPSAHLLNPTKTDETNPSPVKNHRMPTEIHLETHLISSKTHETYHSPSAHLLSPTKTKPSPVKTHPSATEMSETHNNPPETLEMHHNPMETHPSLSVSPAKTYESDPSRSPGEEALIKSNHSQTEKEEHKEEEDCASTNKSCLVAECFHHGEMEGATQVFPALPESHEMQQNPTETHESVPEAHETDHSPSAHLLSLTKTDETKPSPVKTHPSATETHKTDHNPPETLEMQHNLHQIPLQTHDTYHSPSAHLLSPTKTKPSPVKTHPSATEMSETHNNPPETLEMHHNPMETHHSLSVSPAKTYESDPSSSPGEEALIKSNHSQTEKEEHKAEEDCASTNKSCLVAEYFHHGEMEGATQVFPAVPTKSAEVEKKPSSPPVTHPVMTRVQSDSQQPPAHFSASSSGEPKLCGYLQKQGGPLRGWKRRWFTCEEKRNQLFYYRTPQDLRPLGRVDLGAATFTYPLKAEAGTFHIKTPERTFILKAVTQEVMHYWLQQLQVRRWQHRQVTSCCDSTNNMADCADHFLPLLKTPVGLVGEEAASVAPQRTPLANMSIKHLFDEIQNSAHSLRKRSSQEWTHSVFYVQDPAPDQVDSAANVGQTVQDRRRHPLLDRKKNCETVQMSSDQMSRLQQDNEILMEELKAQKELVWLLHKALEAAQLEKGTCADFVAAEGEQERLEHRRRQTADLLSRLEEAKMDEATRRSLAERDLQVSQLQEQMNMLIEKDNAKQEVILKLSNQVAACTCNPLRSADSIRQLQQHVENLKDDIEAYKTQNKFLNSEIYQLTKLWRKSSGQERSLLVKCAHLEARGCQAESRYLGGLQKLQEDRSLDPDQRQIIQKMIEDALKEETKNVPPNTNSNHDKYGFKIIPDYEVEDVRLLAKIQALEMRSQNLMHEESRERPLLSRWAQYLGGRLDDDLRPSPELKGLLRAGVPFEYRQRIWRRVVRARTKSIRERHPCRYQEFCDKSRACPHPVSRQIQMDLHRTLTNNQNFSSPSSPAHQQLQRILLAFSWQNPSIGYCQGLNRLAAIALLVLQNEEDAFWCLVSVVDTIMPQDYYTKNLVASQADQHVFKDILLEKLPRLAAHFKLHGIDVSLVTFNWFLVVFVESLPSDILLPLWDAFLYEGTKVIFRYALALFKYKEDDILKIDDSTDIYQYLRFFTTTVSDGRKLMAIAFGDMNPFPGRLLRNRRASHLERLLAELQELEEQQRSFQALSTKRKDQELDNTASEDDEELS
ncbi:TBC1 domain family member 2A isoform X2 [Nerophis lumbriciformis]|uniref:TBC1 domain family member 2A isoform X2 n=1 Tax=Nerophis lumbriciformis TaxID=546530 RepID=UPI002ADF62AA|nr:TBC1 domain family member 2A-like isoform X2 [Nerophis lumbriciformis]